MNRKTIQITHAGQAYAVSRKRLTKAAAAQGLEWGLEDLAAELLEWLDKGDGIEYDEIHGMAVALYEAARNLNEA